MTYAKIYSFEDGEWASQCVAALERAAADEPLTGDDREALERAVRICRALNEDLKRPAENGISTLGRGIAGLDGTDSEIAISWMVRSDMHTGALEESCIDALAGKGLRGDWLAFMSKPFTHIRDWAHAHNPPSISNAP